MLVPTPSSAAMTTMRKAIDHATTAVARRKAAQWHASPRLVGALTALTRGWGGGGRASGDAEARSQGGEEDGEGVGEEGGGFAGGGCEPVLGVVSQQMVYKLNLEMGGRRPSAMCGRTVLYCRTKLWRVARRSLLLL